MAGVALIAYADGVHVAGVAPGVAAAEAGLDAGPDAGPDGAADPEVLVGWTPAPPAWLESPRLRGTTFFGGYGLAGAVRDGRLRPLAPRLSAVPAMLQRLRPAVAVVPGQHRDGELVFRGTVGTGPAAALAAGAVVVEVDDGAPDLGGPPIPGRVVATVGRDATAAGEARARAPEAVDLAIGRHVAALLPDEPTMQFGPGAVVEGVVRSIERPVRIWSGLLSDAMAELDERGLLLGTATAGYTWGGEPIAGLARAGRLALEPVEVTHDVVAASRLPRFVACNSAVQVGLDGSVNVERVGGRIIAGIGGHADFSAAASHCVDGMSVVALRSTDRRGTSTIVEWVEVVSTPRCDVDVVVTEHGVADLRGVDDRERAERIAAVAAPEHRERLGAAAA
jgi:acyl-CoA hydrolase